MLIRNYLLYLHYVFVFIRYSQERPYMCEKCSKCFRVKYDLTVHTRNVHKEGVQIQRNEPDSSTARLLE